MVVPLSERWCRYRDAAVEVDQEPGGGGAWPAGVAHLPGHGRQGCTPHTEGRTHAAHSR